MIIGPAGAWSGSRPEADSRPAPSIAELRLSAELAIEAVERALRRSDKATQPEASFTRSRTTPLDLRARAIIGHRVTCSCEPCMDFRFGWSRD